MMCIEWHRCCNELKHFIYISESVWLSHRAIWEMNLISSISVRRASKNKLSPLVFLWFFHCPQNAFALSECACVCVHTCCIRFRNSTLLSVFERDNLFITAFNCLPMWFTWFPIEKFDFSTLDFASIHTDGEKFIRRKTISAQSIEQANPFHMGKIDFDRSLLSINVILLFCQINELYPVTISMWFENTNGVRGALLFLLFGLFQSHMHKHVQMKHTHTKITWKPLWKQLNEWHTT